MQRLRLLPALGIAALLSPGCHDHDHDHDHGDGVAEELCFHMENGPSSAVSLPALEAGTQGDVSMEHTRFDITLLPSEAVFTGTVEFQAADEGEYAFALDRAVDFAIFDGSQRRLDAENETIDTSMCADDIATVYVYELAVGTYTLSFGPTDSESVRIVIERVVEHNHSHSGHRH
jgi:hypothetical protein